MSSLARKLYNEGLSQYVYNDVAVDDFVEELEEKISHVASLGQKTVPGTVDTFAELPGNVTDLDVKPTPNDFIYVRSDEENSDQLSIYSISVIDSDTGDITWDLLVTFPHIDISNKMNLVDNPSNGNVLMTNSAGQAVDGGITVEALKWEVRNLDGSVIV